MIFPTVTGSNLDGQRISLPNGLAGEFNLLVITFQQRHSPQVEAWVSHFSALCSRYYDLRCYVLPTIQNLLTLQRDFADAWVRSGSDDGNRRQTTIPLYVDINDFNRALDIPTVSNVYCLLIDREGEVLWRVQGAYDPLKVRRLLHVLNHRCQRREVAAAR
ncbi:MAG: hypothetical protein IAE80_11290 [Anaerolinea sp.]|nr:hypothetical protein [Anaerolinea sp.]